MPPPCSRKIVATMLEADPVKQRTIQQLPNDVRNIPVLPDSDDTGETSGGTSKAQTHQRTGIEIGVASLFLNT